MAETKAKAPVNAKAAEAAEKKKAKAAAAADKKAGGESAPLPKGYVPRLKKIYREAVAPELFKEFSFDSTMQVPRFVKVVVSMGVGEAKTNAKVLDEAVEEMALIAGQRPAITKARKSIASFKLREGMSIGCRVTLRGERMYEMIDRLVSIALPRIRDFRGISPNQFDGRGNFAMGVREQTIFPEIDYDTVETFRGLNIVITTTAKTDEEGRALLAKLGMPFRSN